MKTVIKENVSFNYNFNNHGKIDVLYDNNKLADIDSETYTILCLFNGYLDNSQIINLFQEVFNKDKDESQKILNMFLDKFKFILDKNDYMKRDMKPFAESKTNINYYRIRHIVPKELAISLTRDCFMKCRYCYAGANYSVTATKTHTLSITLIEKIIKEACFLGIKNIELTGGDPFIRNDIFDILKMLKDHKITTSLSTKKILEINDIIKLTQFDNILDFQISLDTLVDSTQEKLVLKKNYSTEMVNVIKKLIENNINVKVNSVITSLNINEIVELSKFLDSIGVKQHVFSPYANNLWKEDVSLFPSYDDYEKLFNNIKSLQLSMKVNHPDISVIKLDDVDEDIYCNKNHVTCTAGLKGFIIGPTGETSICERLLYNTEYSLGNINMLSLVDIWNSDKIKKFHKPDVELFKGTRCYKCEENSYCIYRRGLCYVHSLILNKKIFSEDSLCKYNNKLKRTF